MATVRMYHRGIKISEVEMHISAAEQAVKMFSYNHTDGYEMELERSVYELLSLLKVEETGSLERRIVLSILKSRGFLEKRELFIEGVSADSLICIEV
jgi:hypothetical protein